MKKVIILSLALALVGGMAYANWCARDNVPAATLLFPYITVDTDLAGLPDPTGQTTLTGITNVSSNAVIVHITVWDILSVPQVDFDEILSGYDVLQINWRDFLNGRFDMFDTAATAFTAASPYTFDPFEFGPDGRAQIGGLTAPQNRTAITTCGTVPPYGNRSDLAAQIRLLLTGALKAYTHDGCTAPGALRTDLAKYGATLTASPIFFYVTVDVVQRCNLLFPNAVAYWDFGATSTGIATYNNVLIGDTIYVKPAPANLSEMFPAVHIEASNVQATGEPALVSFYEEKVAVETNREPLGTAFAFRYGNSVADNTTSNVILWKNFNEVGVPITTAGSISDCGAYLYYAWDNDERSLSRVTAPISGLPTGGNDPNQFPFETQKVPVNNSYFDLPGTYGWMLIVLPPSYPVTGFVDPTTNATLLGRNYMGWAGMQFVYGTYSAGIEAATMANYHCFGAGQVTTGFEQQLRSLNTYNGSLITYR